MPTLDRNGVTIYYEVHGNGPAVLLSHGYSADLPHVGRSDRGLQGPATGSSYGICAATARAPTRKDAAAYSETLTVADIAAILRRL